PQCEQVHPPMKASYQSIGMRALGNGEEQCGHRLRGEMNKYQINSAPQTTRMTAKTTRRNGNQALSASTWSATQFDSDKFISHLTIEVSDGRASARSLN